VIVQSLTVLLLVTAGNPARPDSVVLLPEVRVTGRRPEPAAQRRVPSGFVSDLATGVSHRALETLPELLGGAPGVRITHYGGLGAFSTVSLRGAPPGQVAVYLDGAPVTSASQSVVNLADLPFMPVEKVEVYRGSSPLALGGAAPGGAINLVTSVSPEVHELRVAGGAFGTLEAGARTGWRRGTLDGSLHAGWQRSEGNFRYLDGNGTDLNPDDDTVETRLNNGFEAATLFGTLGWSAPGGVRVQARQHLLSKAQGVPGLGAVPATATRLELARSLTQLEVAGRGAGGWPSFALDGAVARDRSRYRDLEGELGLGRIDADQRFASDRLSLGLEWPAAPRGFAFDGGAALRRETATLEDGADGQPDPPPSERRTRSGYAGVTLRPLGEALLLRAAQRWDHITDGLHSASLGAVRTRELQREVASPQLGARLRLGGALELRGNWTRASRPPGFLELFGNQGSVLGNPQLKDETSENWDAGVRLELGRGGRWSATLEYAHFASDARDLILYRRNSQSSVKAENIARAEIVGDEFSLALAAPGGLSLAGSLTAQAAHDRSAIRAYRDKWLPQRPAHLANLRAGWARGRWALGADLQHLGPDYLDRYNQRRAPARTLVGASASVAALTPGLRFTVEGKNLGDERATDVAGFPLPGRSLFVSFDLRLGLAGGHRP
jgi:iron complex outermembrane receptor protein